MRRLIAAAVFGVGAFGTIGCAGSASLVHQAPDGSAVIALKANGNMADAQKLATKTLGGEVEIVGTTQLSLQPGFAPADQSVMHYVYKLKTQSNVAGLPPAPGGVRPAGYTGQPGSVRPAGYTGQPGGGVVPAVGTGMPGGTSGFGTAGQPPAMFPASK